MGFLHLASPQSFTGQLEAFRRALRENGFVEGGNLRIVYGWANGQLDKLPGLAAEMVDAGASVIATGGAELPVLAARAATKTIPIIFLVGGDPVLSGLVTNLARPTENLSGVTILTSTLEAKRLSLLRDVAPSARRFAALVNPTRTVAGDQIAELEGAARNHDMTLTILKASSDEGLREVAARLKRGDIDAFQVCADPWFYSRRAEVVTLANEAGVPAIYEWREYAEVGGLASYGTSLSASYEQVGQYVARILKGARVADLPVVMTSRFEFVLNARTAKLIRFDFPPTTLTLADEIID